MASSKDGVLRNAEARGLRFLCREAVFKPTSLTLPAGLHCQNPGNGSQESTPSVYPELPYHQPPLLMPGYRGHAEYHQLGLQSWQQLQSRSTVMGADRLLSTQAPLPGLSTPTSSRGAVEARVAGSLLPEPRGLPWWAQSPRLHTWEASSASGAPGQLHTHGSL